MTEILAARLDVTFDTLSGSLPFINDGSVRPLAVSTKKRISRLPDVPTRPKQAFPTYQEAMHGHQPRHPAQAAARDRREALNAIADRALKEREDASGAEDARHRT